MKRLFLSILCLGLLQLSCSEPTSEAYSFCGNVSKGTPIYSGLNTNYMTLIFSKTTNELIAAGDSGIHIIDLSTHSLRTIENSDDVNYIRLSNDGTKLFYILTGNLLAGDEAKPLYSMLIDGTERQLLVEEVFISNDAFFTGYGCFLMSPDDQKVVYTREYNELYLYDLPGNSTTSLNIHGLPMVFSPDGINLIYNYDNEGYSRIHVESGYKGQTAFATGTEIDNIYGFFWNENGLSICYGPTWHECCFYNLTTNKALHNWKHSAWYDDYYFSADGKKAIIWRWAAELHFIDVTARSETIVACCEEWNACTTTKLAISPDASQAAYAIDAKIYITNLP